MNNFLTDDTKAIILLCGIFAKDRSIKPLSLTEYSSLVRWLIEVKKRPSNLLQQEYITKASMGSGIDRQRLESLLGRGVQLGFAVEEWQRNGIWIISRSDADYPDRYKKHLKEKAPPLLFGVGDRALLNGGGLSIVGSRNVDQDGEVFTRRVAELCANNRIPVVSGGARGVDQISMKAALDANGVVIGILAENLLKKSVERSARHAIADGRLLLLSPYHPNARFTVGTAMGRNKLIYAMADYGLIVSAEYKKGGTWTGAQEELKRDVSRPLFVRSGNNLPSGNNKLLELGAIAWPKNIDQNNFRQRLFNLVAKNEKKRDEKVPTLLDFQNIQETTSIEGQKTINESVHKEEHAIESEAEEKDCHKLIYQAVLPIILDMLEKPISVEDLASSLDVNKTQLKVWIKKAVNENKIVKLNKPLRYQIPEQELLIT